MLLCLPAQQSGGGRTLGSAPAFTLAEVLVTLGIIGVVSAMTVPSLMQNHQKKTYVTQLHKVYNELSQAAMRFQTDNNAVNLKEAGINSQAGLDNFIKTSFKIVQDCGADSTPCFAPNSEYKKISGVAAEGTYLAAYVTLASGASLGYSYNTGNAAYIAKIDVDINGQKGPNIAGRDMFALKLYNNGLIDDGDDVNPAPLTKEQREGIYNSSCISSSASWRGCFGKILNDNWEMNY